MWREKIASLCSAPQFQRPVTAAALADAQRMLNSTFPRELSAALAESDGMAGDYGLALLWPITRIVEDNVRFRASDEFRTLYMPFDSLLFFGDAGNGDQFAFTIMAGEVRRDDIFVWNHETDSRTWVAPNLITFFDWWLSGKLTI